MLHLFSFEVVFHFLSSFSHYFYKSFKRSPIFAMFILNNILSLIPKEFLTNIMILGGVIETQMDNQIMWGRKYWFKGISAEMFTACSTSQNLWHMNVLCSSPKRLYTLYFINSKTCLFSYKNVDVEMFQ